MNNLLTKYSLSKDNTETVRILYYLVGIRNGDSDSTTKQKCQSFRNKEGMSLLHLGCLRLDLACIRLALDMDIDVNILNNNGENCLECLLRSILCQTFRGKPYLYAIEGQVQMIKSLLLAGVKYEDRQLFEVFLNFISKDQKDEILNCIADINLR